MRATGVRKIVFSSSATVYGTPQFLPYTEEHPLQAVNPYGRTKLMIEEKANPKCADGRTYARNTVNCEVGADGQAKCTGSQPGDKRSYNVQIGR